GGGRQGKGEASPELRTRHSEEEVAHARNATLGPVSHSNRRWAQEQRCRVGKAKRAQPYFCLRTARALRGSVRNPLSSASKSAPICSWDTKTPLRIKRTSSAGATSFTLMPGSGF